MTNHEPIGDALMPDTRNTIPDTADPGGAADAASLAVVANPDRDGMGASVDEPVGYRIRILEPLEVSSPMEVHSYPDRASAIDTVLQIATKLTLRGFTSYRINILDPNDRTVWTMTRPGRGKESRHGG